MKENKYKYEIREIDAWAGDEEGSWTWNTSFHLGEFETSAENHSRAFLNALHRLGVVCIKGKCKVDFDGEIYELQDRKTNEPLFAAIPCF